MIKLSSMHIFPNFDVPDQIRRRVETSLTTSTASTLGSLFAQHGQEAIRTSEYQMNLSDICRFSSSPDGYEKPIVNISEEHGVISEYRPTSRIYNFVAELVTRDANHMSLIETSYIVSGYTSEAEPTITGLLPEDMVLFINDIHGLQTVYQHDATGGLCNPRQRSVDNYVLANLLSNHGNVLSNQEYMVNPGSIASTGVMIDSIPLDDGESLAGTVFNPTLGTSVSGAQIYSSDITKPENLMGSVISAYANHEMNAESNEDDITSAIFNSPHVSISQFVAGTRSVATFSSHGFVRALTAGLRRRTTGSEKTCAQVETTAKFTLGDFMKAIENPHDLLSQISSGIMHSKRNMSTLDTQETTDDWVGRNGYSTRGSIVAYDIAMRLGPILSDSLIGRCQVAYDSTEVSLSMKGKMHIFPESIGSLSRSSTSLASSQRFKNKLEEMFFKVTEYGKLPLTVVVKAVLGTATRIEVKIDGEAWERYTFASFMSSRLHIGMTNDRNYINELGKDASKLYGEIREGFGEFRRLSNIANITEFTPSSVSGGVLSQFESATPVTAPQRTIDLF